MDEQEVEKITKQLQQDLKEFFGKFKCPTTELSRYQAHVKDKIFEQYAKDIDAETYP